MVAYSANIDLLFKEFETTEQRIEAAAKAGFHHVEMWMTSHLDLASVKAVADANGVQITSILAEPRFSFTMPGVDMNVFFDGLRESIKRAKALGAPRIVLGSGMGFPGKKRQQNLDELVVVFKEAAKIAEAENIQLVLEPVNTRVDHPGALLDRTAEAIYIADQVASPNFKILYDIYHSVVEGENPLEILANNISSIGYLQLADTPGRGEPGSGKIDWKPILAAVEASGYRDQIGLEYYPTKETVASLEYLRSL